MSGDLINESLTTGSPTTAASVKWHKTAPVARTRFRPTAQYVTEGRAEIIIKQLSSGRWHAYFFKGGQLPEALSGQFTSHRACETEVIKYLRNSEKWGKAIWPNR